MGVWWMTYGRARRSGVGHYPQRLKPRSWVVFYGTTEVVRFPKGFLGNRVFPKGLRPNSRYARCRRAKRDYGRLGMRWGGGGMPARPSNASSHVWQPRPDVGHPDKSCPSRTEEFPVGPWRFYGTTEVVRFPNGRISVGRWRPRTTNGSE